MTTAHTIAFQGAEMAIDHIKLADIDTLDDQSIDNVDGVNIKTMNGRTFDSSQSSIVSPPGSPTVRVVSTYSRVGDAQWPVDMYRVKEAGTADQSIYVRGKSVRDSMSKFHAKGLVVGEYSSIEQRMLKNHRHNGDRAAAAASSTPAKKRKHKLLSLISSIFSKSSKKPSSKNAPSTPRPSADSGVTKAISNTSEYRVRDRSSQISHRYSASPASSPPSSPSSPTSDPLLSRLFRAPIRKNPNKLSKSSGSAANPTATTATSSSSKSSAAKTKKRSKKAKSSKVARSALESSAPPTSITSPMEHENIMVFSSADNSENEGNMEERLPRKKQYLPSGCPFTWNRSTKVTSNSQTSSHHITPSATGNTTPIVAASANRKPPRQRVSPSGLYLLICVGLCCMPCLCVNYACNRDEEL